MLQKLLAFYQISITRSVLLELTRANLSGSTEFQEHVLRNDIRVIDVGGIPSGCITAVDSVSSLDQGEFDTIKCYETGGLDLIIIDDGRAARYCRENNLPFVNALLFPRILCFTGTLSMQECNDKMADIVRLGRYSAEVIEWAKNCSRDALEFAISGVVA